METAQKKCLGIFDEAEEKVIAAGIIFMVLMETVNTIFKFVHPSAAGLPEELANFAYTWVAFLCASFCTKRGANIIVDALTNLYPKALRNVLEYVCHDCLRWLSVCGQDPGRGRHRKNRFSALDCVSGTDRRIWRKHHS